MNRIIEKIWHKVIFDKDNMTPFTDTGLFPSPMINLCCHNARNIFQCLGKITLKRKESEWLCTC